MIKYLVTVYGKHDVKYAQYTIYAYSEREAIDKGIERYNNSDWDSVGAKKIV